MKKFCFDDALLVFQAGNYNCAAEREMNVKISTDKKLYFRITELDKFRSGKHVLNPSYPNILHIPLEENIVQIDGFDYTYVDLANVSHRVFLNSRDLALYKYGAKHESDFVVRVMGKTATLLRFDIALQKLKSLKNKNCRR
jgi:hypothetical protein